MFSDLHKTQYLHQHCNSWLNAFWLILHQFPQFSEHIWAKSICHRTYHRLKDPVLLNLMYLPRFVIRNTDLQPITSYKNMDLPKRLSSSMSQKSPFFNRYDLYSSSHHFKVCIWFLYHSSWPTQKPSCFFYFSKHRIVKW